MNRLFIMNSTFDHYSYVNSNFDHYSYVNSKVDHNTVSQQYIYRDVRPLTKLSYAQLWHSFIFG